MKAFEHARPESIEAAISLLSDDREETALLAGGTDLITVMRERITEPDRLVNLKFISGLDSIEFVDGPGGAVAQIGPLVTLDRLDRDPEVAARLPVLSDAAGEAASPQIRNQGTIGGNLCQKSRCPYYRDPALFCYKRGGLFCYAEDGDNRYHALFGGGPSFTVHPSDLAPALVALGATLVLEGPGGRREVSAEEFHVLPIDDPTQDNVLGPKEIITRIDVPVPPPDRSASTYLKSSLRGSWDFALVSVAVATEQQGGKTTHARIVLGGVAPKPWRVPEAEKILLGKPLDDSTAAAAAEAALEGAQPLSGNAYKIPLGRTLVDPLTALGAWAEEHTEEIEAANQRYKNRIQKIA